MKEILETATLFIDIEQGFRGEVALFVESLEGRIIKIEGLEDANINKEVFSLEIFDLMLVDNLYREIYKFNRGLGLD